MLQFNLNVFDEGTVNPFLGGGAAGLADNSSKIALSEAHLVGIEADLVLVSGMLVDEGDKSIEDGLFTTL